MFNGRDEQAEGAGRSPGSASSDGDGLAAQDREARGPLVDVHPAGMRLSRRSLLVGSAALAAGQLGRGMGKPLVAGEPRPEQPADDGIWDAHCHLTGASGSPEERITALLSFADRMGIGRLIIFMGYPFVYDPSPAEVRRQNDQVMRALEHARGRALGYVYLNPKHPDESVKELDRCVRDGPMVGVKLWVAVHCTDPRLDPIVRRATELKAPVLQHTWEKITGCLPGESIPPDLAALARRHPEATFIAAHTGGDWERGIRAVRACENVFAEICGSDPTAGMVEMAVRELGARRVIYASDAGGRSFASQLAKVYGADVPDPAKRLILGGNIRRILKPILTAKGWKA